MEISGIRIVGLSAENGRNVLATIILLVAVWGLRWLLQRLAIWLERVRSTEHSRFWVHQGINLFSTLLVILGLMSIWFGDPANLATAIGLITAGLAFALQRVVTSVAGYFVILRGNTFSIGDRITMGGVRGDVIDVGLIQTTIMEMGPPAGVQATDPALLTQSRQYTGRVVIVSNARIFDDPIYNYTRDFPFLWEEITLSVPHTVDRAAVERIMLDVAGRHTSGISEAGRKALGRMRQAYLVQPSATDPRVYVRLAGATLELTVRFLTEAQESRDLRDAVTRDILHAFDEAGISLAPD
jgi:small-conductance mechanosensitive channel